MLVLSLFPGIGLLDRAFEEEGFTVVRGPDVLWGGDVRAFHAPPGRFDGVIGGPPCQVFSPMASFGGVGFGNLIPEFERVVAEAQPDWWLMENVPTAPEPAVDGYAVRHLRLNNRWVGDGLGAEQNRVRRFSFGTRSGAPLPIEEAPLFNPVFANAVTSAHAGDNRVRAKGTVKRYRVPEAARLQGLPATFLEHAPFTEQGKLKAIANGVPLPLGRAVAQAVKRALASQPALNPVRNRVG